LQFGGKIVSLEDIELNIGGTNFKGVWIAILLSFASTIGGGIWATSEFFSRLESQEEAVQEASVETQTLSARFQDLKDLNTAELANFEREVNLMKQRLDDNNVAGLSAKLAELGANLETIMKQQQELLNLREKVEDMGEKVAVNDTIVASVKDKFALYDRNMAKFQRDLDDAWKAMDALSNPLQ